MTYWVYILASEPGGTLYVGVTNNLVRRVYEHREGLAEGFTKRYHIKCWYISSRTKQSQQRFNARRTSSIGPASGKLI
jgi:predicted GIY-YIG superfamily endonuclease